MIFEMEFGTWLVAYEYGLSVYGINVKNLKKNIDRIKTYSTDGLEVVYIDNEWAFTITSSVNRYMLRYKDTNAGDKNKE